MPHPPNLLNTIRLCCGATKVLKVAFKTQEGRKASLAGATLYFTVQGKLGEPPLISLVSPDDITITDAANGLATITIPSDATVLAKGCYRYDLWVEYPGTPPERYCVVHSAEFMVSASVTTFVSP